MDFSPGTESASPAIRISDSWHILLFALIFDKAVCTLLVGSLRHYHPCQIVKPTQVSDLHVCHVVSPPPRCRRQMASSWKRGLLLPHGVHIVLAVFWSWLWCEVMLSSLPVPAASCVASGVLRCELTGPLAWLKCTCWGD